MSRESTLAQFESILVEEQSAHVSRKYMQPPRGQNQQSENELPMYALGTMCKRATMLLAIYASAPILLAVIARAFTFSRSREQFLMRLDIQASPPSRLALIT